MDGARLRVGIMDDGIGLPSGTHTSVGNGLRNMNKRIAVLGGEFRTDVLGGSGAPGTRIGFTVPIDNQGSIGRSNGSGELRTR